MNSPRPGRQAIQATWYSPELSVPLTGTSGSAQRDAPGGNQHRDFFQLLLMPSPPGRAMCGRVCTERGWGAPGEPLGVPHPPAASPVLTLDAKTPQEMPPGMGMLLKDKDTGVSGKSPAIPHGSSPKPHPETPP